MMTREDSLAVSEQMTNVRGWRRYSWVILLCLIILVGAYFRFVGLNWDDFAYPHPDERFLTLNLLPNVGGTNQFTRDDLQFPPQALLARVGETRVQGRVDVEQNPNLRVGFVIDTMSEQAAQWWLGDSGRLQGYATADELVRALVSGQMDVGILGAGEATLYSGSLRQADLFNSEELQQFNCLRRYPDSGGIGGYFDAQCSPLNPHNSANGFYAYGTLPLFMAHFASQFVQTVAPDQFQTGALVWRFLSAVFDIGSIILVFLVGSRLHHRYVGLLAAILYAAAPLAIQKAHYGTVNAITAFFVMLGIYFAVRAQEKGGWWSYLGFGIACGAALSGRINTAPLAGLIVLAALVYSAPALDASLPWLERRRFLLQAIIGLLLAGVATIVTFRILNPYAFTGPGFLGLTPNPRWLADAAAASYGVSGAQDSPPNWQWMGRPSYVYPLKDMLLWGMGIAFGGIAWVGWVWSGYRLARGRLYATRNLLLFVWVLVYFGWLGRLWVMTMRYYLPIYGALAVLAAWALAEWARLARQRGEDVVSVRVLLVLFGALLAAIGIERWLSGVFEMGIIALSVGLLLGISALFPRFYGKRAQVLAAFVVLFTVVWAIMFTHIYRQQVTRVQASRWAWEQIPGDFYARIEGAPPQTPLVNIAIRNRSADSAGNAQELFAFSTSYAEGVPEFAEFIAPADGIISALNAPYLGDPLDDDGLESLYISISDALEGEPLATATLTADFVRDEHVLGRPYEIPLSQPITLKAGQRYFFKVEALAGGGPIIGGGAIVLTEGDWDDRLTTIKICDLPHGLTTNDNPPSGLVAARDCIGRESRYGLVNSYDMYMSLDVDSVLKRDTILEALKNGDYLAITSNRFYDTLTRNPMRWPMSTRYYEALFKGELGYDLVAVFDETYEWGPLRVSDQHLPTYQSPSWLNEFEADEAFHVYDHPAVFIFQKRADYSSEAARYILESVPISRPEEIIEPSQLVGVVFWSSLDAARAPTFLQLTSSAWALQQAGGTWSERFFSQSLANTNQLVGVVMWWSALMLFGWVAWPILFTLFPSLSDRGYGFAKFAGLLLVGWLLWVPSSAQIAVWSQAGVLGALALLGVVSYLLVRRSAGRFGAYIREHWRQLAWIEAITFVLFLLFIFVRLTNPDLWHYAKGGEKPMDFAYFNAVLRSTVFPPYDPWYAGGYINYYYFGFVLVGSPVLLLGLVPSFAYNLIIPTLFAITGIGAFSVAYNVVSAWRERTSFVSTEEDPPTRHLGNPWVAGVAALLLCVVFGNLDTVRVIGNGIAQLGGYQPPLGIEDYLRQQTLEAVGRELTPQEEYDLINRINANFLSDRIAYEVQHSLSLVSGLAQGLGKMFSGQPLPIGSDRWYWGPSRVLAETPGVGGNAITEMPYFTFLYGDLHAHMINLPVLLFVVAFLWNEFLLVGRDERGIAGRFFALALGALAVGIIRATNTWDWPSFLLLSVAALSFYWWLRWKETIRPLDGLAPWLLVVGGLLLIFIVLNSLVGQYTLQAQSDLLTRVLGVGRIFALLLAVALAGWIAVRWIFTRWSLLNYLLTVGGFVVLSFAVVIPYTTWYAATYNSVRLWDGGKSPLWAYFDIHGLFLFLLVSLLLWETARWARTVYVGQLRGRAWAVYGVLGVLGVVFVGAIVAAMLNYQVALIVVPLVVWIAALFFRPGQSVPMRFVLALAAYALALTLGVEVIVVDGDIGRQNTVFKFYLQAWVLFSVVGGAAFAWVLQSSETWTNRLRGVWLTPLMILSIVAALYPFMATRGRAADRQAPATPLTLDGLAYMQYATYSLFDYPASIEMKDDYELIRWMQEHIKGTPVIIEGRSIVSEYRYNGRIAINTGLPSVLGWNFHQRQQRTFNPMPSLVEQREKNIKYFYSSADIPQSALILHHYGVRYVVAGVYEHMVATPEALAKLETMAQEGILKLVYEDDDSPAKLYEVNPTQLGVYLRDWLNERAQVGVTQ